MRFKKRNWLAVLGLTVLLVLSLLTAREKSTAYTAQKLSLFNTTSKPTAWKVVKVENDAPTAYWYLTNEALVITQNGQHVRLKLPENFYEMKIARNNQFFALNALWPANPTKGSNGHLRVQIITNKGRQQCVAFVPFVTEESIPMVTVLGNGRFVVGHSEIGRLDFYAPNGQRTQTVTLFPEAEYDLERVLKIKPSADGQTIAVLASKRGSAPLDSKALKPNGEPYVFLFDAEGKEWWRQPLKVAAGQNLEIAADGSQLIVSGYSTYLTQPLLKKTVLMQNDGKQIKDYPFLFRQACFGNQSKQILLADRNTVRQLDAQNGTLLWQRTIEAQQGTISAIQLDETNQTAVVLVAHNRFQNGGFVFEEPSLLIFDKQGQKVQHMPFTQETFVKPQMQVVQGKIFLGFQNNFYQVEVQK